MKDKKAHTNYKKLLDDSKKLNTDYKDSLQRLQADFENYQKRATKEKLESSKTSVANFVSQLLPIIDSFEADNTESPIKDLFIKTLTDSGLEEIDSSRKFDPYFHEALMTAPDKEDNKILEVFQKGYKFDGRVIRHTKVKVSKIENNKTDSKGDNTKTC